MWTTSQEAEGVRLILLILPCYISRLWRSVWAEIERTKAIFFFARQIGERKYVKSLPYDGWSMDEILSEIDELMDLGKHFQNL